jgi:hypothetical protein
MHLYDSLADILLDCEISSIEGNVKVSLDDVENGHCVFSSVEKTLYDVPTKETTSTNNEIAFRHCVLKMGGR